MADGVVDDLDIPVAVGYSQHRAGRAHRANSPTWAIPTRRFTPQDDWRVHPQPDPSI